jgi:hypothetical protein
MKEEGAQVAELEASLKERDKEVEQLKSDRQSEAHKREKLQVPPPSPPRTEWTRRAPPHPSC